MKTTIKILTLLLVLNTTALLAFGGASHSVKPAAAAEGTEVALIRPEILTARISPITPKVADFEETIQAIEVDIDKIAPAPPSEPEFEEIVTVSRITAEVLAPVTPTEADFTK